MHIPIWQRHKKLTKPFYNQPNQTKCRDVTVSAFFFLSGLFSVFIGALCKSHTVVDYVRHHLLSNQDKMRIRNTTEQLTGVKLSGLAGLYCHFLLQSYQWMEDDGVTGWLIPSEFMDVNYGKEVKQFLLNETELLKIHRFDPNDVQFDDALVSSSVVWFKKKKRADNYCVEFSYGGSLNNPKTTKKVDKLSLLNEAKWTRFPLMEVRVATQENFVLSDFFMVKRGLATGNNDFFIMNMSKIIELELPLEFFRPVLPSARFVNENEIVADDNGNPLLLQQLFLLDCRLPENQVAVKFPTLWEYLESGKPTVSDGYLCKSRKCWYFQEQRESPPYICTYMGRENSENGKAFRFILNNSNATVTNSYLALYPKEDIKVKLCENPNLKRKLWKLLNDINPTYMSEEGRVYGGGLRKMEPSELSRLPVPNIAELLA